MSVRFLKGYWTVFSGEQPVLSCTSLAKALAHFKGLAFEVQA